VAVTKHCHKTSYPKKVKQDMFDRVTDIDKLIEVQKWSKEELKYSRRSVYLDYIYIKRNIWSIFWIYFLAPVRIVLDHIFVFDGV
jgi:hypothetical protein